VRYSCTLSLTSALDGGGWSTSRSGRLTPGKDTRYPWYRRLGGSQGYSGRLQKISLCNGIRFPDCPARNKSLCRLRYPGTPLCVTYFNFTFLRVIMTLKCTSCASLLVYSTCNISLTKTLYNFTVSAVSAKNSSGRSAVIGNCSRP
jgi:hypothetical protein